MGAQGADAIHGAAAAHSVAKRPGAVKYEATATRRYPWAVSARTASGTVGAAAEAYAGSTGTPRRSARRAAVRPVSVRDSGSREPAEARTTAPSRGARVGQPASVRRSCRASTSRECGPRGAATPVRAGEAAAISGMSCLTW